jgi:hypothetical protein
VCIRYCGNVSTEPLPSNDEGTITKPLSSNDSGIFTEPLPSNDEGAFTKLLPSNDRGIFTEPLPSNDKGAFTEPLPSNDRGYTDTQREQGDLISLLSFFQNKESRLKTNHVAVMLLCFCLYPARPLEGSHNKQRLFPQTALTGWAL